MVSTNELAGVASVDLTNDPVAAIRSVLPKGWTVAKVDENAYPPHGPKAKGRAICVFSPDQRLGPMQSKESVLYIMPANYRDGGEEPPQEQQYRARLVLTTPTAKVYLRGDETPFSSTGWPTLKDDIIKALVRSPGEAQEAILDIKTQKAEDHVKVQIENDTATFDVSSQSGIGGATITMIERQVADDRHSSLSSPWP